MIIYFEPINYAVVVIDIYNATVVAVTVVVDNDILLTVVVVVSL